MNVLSSFILRLLKFTSEVRYKSNVPFAQKETRKWLITYYVRKKWLNLFRCILRCYCETCAK